MDFNIIKLTFGSVVLIGFFFVITIIMFLPEKTNDVILVLVGQLSAGFILVLRHVFQSKTVKTNG